MDRCQCNLPEVEASCWVYFLRTSQLSYYFHMLDLSLHPCLVLIILSSLMTYALLIGAVSSLSGKPMADPSCRNKGRVSPCEAKHCISLDGMGVSHAWWKITMFQFGKPSFSMDHVQNWQFNWKIIIYLPFSRAILNNQTVDQQHLRIEAFWFRMIHSFDWLVLLGIFDAK